MHRGPSGDGRGGRGRVHARARRGRPFPALQSVVAALLDTGLWLLALPLAAVAIAVAFVGGARILPAYAAVVLYGLSAAGFVWVLWSFTELELPYEQDEGVNLLVRLCGSLVVVSAGLVPLLLDAAWHGADPADRSPADQRRSAASSPRSSDTGAASG